jgi:hypothetical protein
MIWQVLVTEVSSSSGPPSKVASVTVEDGQVFIGIYDYDENFDSFQGRKITDFAFDMEELLAMLAQLSEFNNERDDR